MIDLFPAFYDLATSVSDKVQQHKAKKNGAIERFEHEYRPVKDLDDSHVIELKYTLDRENFSRYFVYKWNVLSMGKFIENEIEYTKEYSHAILSVTEYLEPIRKIPQDRYKPLIRGILHQFIIFLCKHTVQDDFDFQLLEDYSNIFKNDLTKGNKIVFNATMYLANISLDDPEIELAPNVYIRKLRAEDLNESTRDLYEEPWAKLGGKSINILTALEATVELPVNMSFKLSDTARKELNDKLENTLNALRLYAVSQAFEYEIHFSAETILYGDFNRVSKSPFSGKHQLGGSVSRFSEFHFRITKNEANNLRLFIEKLGPDLAKINQSTYYKGEPFEIGFHRYIDSILRSHHNTLQISYAIYVLDALFVRDSEYNKLKDKLLNRSSRLLALLDVDDFAEIREHLDKAYTIRSKLVHGGSIGHDLLEYSERETKRILNYARIALIFCLQSGEIGKDGIIDILERANRDKSNDTLSEFKEVIKHMLLPL